MRILLLLGFLFLFSSSQILDVASVTRLDDFTIDYVYDASGEKKLEDIKNATFEKNSNAFLFPETKGAYWVHIRIRNPTENILNRMITSSTNLSGAATFYEVSPAGTLLRTVAQDRFTSLEQKELYLTAASHKVTLQPNETLDLYIRMHSEGFAMFGRFLLLDHKELMKHVKSKDIIHYFYFGVVFAILVYNIFIYLYYRDPIYIYYNLYLIFLSIWYSEQIGVYTFFAPSEYWALPYYVIPFVDLFLILFTKELLQSQIKTKVFKRWNTAYIWLFFILFIISFFSLEGMLILASLASSTFFIYAFYIVLKGNKKTMPYSIAFGIYMITGLNVPLISFGLLPYSEFTINANIIGAIIETLMLSVILANRINELKQEKLAMQTEMTMIKENQNLLLKEQVAKQTKELRLLFQELHHRVKNNFQFILTFLWVQKESIKDPVAVQALQQTTNRIETISRLHELLSQNSETTVHFHQYVEVLLQTYRQEHGSNIFITDVNRDLKFDFDTTVTLGLILNELVTNSIKYAFADTQRPQITIHLSKTDDHYTLLYQDNGAGVDTSKLDECSGFGFELIHEFVKKMQNASIKIASNSGFEMRLDFESEENDA